MLILIKAAGHGTRLALRLLCVLTAAIVSNQMQQLVLITLCDHIQLTQKFFFASELFFFFRKNSENVFFLFLKSRF